MHKLFLDRLSPYTIKKDLSPAIVYKYEMAYLKKNKENIAQKNQYENRVKEIGEGQDNLDEKHYIKNEMTKEKYDALTGKLNSEKTKIIKLLEKFTITSSNLSEKIIQASQISRKLTEIWQSGGYDKKTRLQNLIFPEGITFDKKTGVLLTPKINEAIVEIARLSGDLAINKKGLNTTQSIKSLVAETERFELSLPCGKHAFQACSFGHSDKSPF